MVSVPETFIVNKFYQYAGGVKHNKHQHTYNGSCPICREGRSWLKKKRSYYIPKKNIICCHNCGWYSSPFEWIKEAGSYTNISLIKEIKEDNSTDYKIFEVKESKRQPQQKLPSDCINLFNNSETSYWKDNYIFQKAQDIVRDRRLNLAINRPDALYLTLNDYVHKNRIIIPFYDSNKDIAFYQSRKILDSDTTPKYLSKVGEEKSIFGMDKIDSSFSSVFITEGPIDAFFIKNGVAVAGITQTGTFNFTNKQEQQFKELFLFDRVWLLDNQHLDRTSKLKTKKLLENGHKVFIWPDRIYKDLNDLCIDKKINEVEPSFILDNTFTKLKGLVKLTNIS
jgi:hypothetical protein